MITQTHLDELLTKRQIHWELHPEERKKLPSGQAFVIVCNRLLEGVDELILAAIFNDLGSDYQILPETYLPANPQEEGSFRPFPELIERIRSGESNRQLADSLERLRPAERCLGLLIEFAGSRLGEVRKTKTLNHLFANLQQLERPIVPMRLDLITEGNIPPAGARILQRLRPGPLHIRVRIGSPVSLSDQQRFAKVDTFRRYLQSRVFALGSDLEVRSFFLRALMERHKDQELEPIAEEVDSTLIETEIRNLRYQNLIASQGNFDILVAQATAIPHTLQEIGRLREITFREVGEGTGKARDIDEFDLYYHQLIIWDQEAKKIVGGYRMGMGDEIYAKMGVEGFYIHSLFQIKAGFVPIMKRSVELGRSYVRPEYQKKRLPLFLLWKGILFFLLKNPQYQYLYGPMSISKYYSDLSKSLIVAFIKKYYYNPYLAAFLKPRKPFYPKVENIDLDVVMQSVGDEIRQLDSLIEDIEPEHFKVPVLMRQYIKLNARFISFNVDPNFSDVLDGFIMLDLKDVPYSMIEALKKEV